MANKYNNKEDGLEDKNKYDDGDNIEVVVNKDKYHVVDNNQLNKKTRAEHYEMLYQKVLSELETGEGNKKKTTIVILEDLWRLANIEAAFQEINLSDVIANALVAFIKTENGH